MIIVLNVWVYKGKYETYITGLITWEHSTHLKLTHNIKEIIINSIFKDFKIENINSNL